MRLGSEGDMPEAGTPKKRVDDNFEEKTKKRKFSCHTEGATEKVHKFHTPLSKTIFYNSPFFLPTKYISTL
jgi:hypothetical protein